MTFRALAVAAILLAAAPLRAEDAVVRVERAAGPAVEGRLVRLDAAGLALDVDGRETVVGIDEVRSAERSGAASAPEAAGVRVTLVDGGWIEGDDAAWDGKAVSVSRSDGTVTIPSERVRTVAWRRPAADAAGAPGEEWIAGIPDDVASDLLVVAAAEGHEFVECAITAIGPDAVAIVLDEEKIPVKRSKVAGVHWLRPADAGGAGGGVAVEMVGGSIRGGAVEWTPAGMVVDGAISLPSAAVRRLDWSDGRTVALAAVAPERLAVEPWFGGLAGIAALAPHLAPRVVAAGEGFPRGGMVVRPRTVAVWRVPPESRRFRASVAPERGAAAVGASVVVVAVDDREAFRSRLDATAVSAAAPEGLPLDIDLAGARRLSITVDFADQTSDGCALRFSSPVIQR